MPENIDHGIFITSRWTRRLFIVLALYKRLRFALDETRLCMPTRGIPRGPTNVGRAIIKIKQMGVTFNRVISAVPTWPNLISTPSTIPYT